MQVAAPPKGSISVGWLWVSFLNSSSQSCVSPSTWILSLTVQALISSDSSSLSSRPCFLRYFARDRAQIHQRDGLFAVQLAANAQVVLIGSLHMRVLELDMVDFGQEGGVAAVV